MSRISENSEIAIMGLNQLLCLLLNSLMNNRAHRARILDGAVLLHRAAVRYHARKHQMTALQNILSDSNAYVPHV